MTMATLKTTRADFESVWPSLVTDLQEAAKKYNVPQNALDWFTKVWHWIEWVQELRY